MATTGDLTSKELLEHERECTLESFNNEVAIGIGEVARDLAQAAELPITVDVRNGDWTVFKIALPGAESAQDGWIARKARVVELTHHSTMYERVLSEERGSDWHLEHGVADETHAIHGGGFPLKLEDGTFVGSIIVSGLPMVDDHFLAVEIIRTYKAQGSLHL